MWDVSEWSCFRCSMNVWIAVIKRSDNDFQMVRLKRASVTLNDYCNHQIKWHCVLRCLCAGKMRQVHNHFRVPRITLFNGSISNCIVIEVCTMHMLSTTHLLGIKYEYYGDFMCVLKHDESLSLRDEFFCWKFCGWCSIELCEWLSWMKLPCSYNNNPFYNPAISSSQSWTASLRIAFVSFSVPYQRIRQCHWTFCSQKFSKTFHCRTFCEILSFFNFSSFLVLKLNQMNAVGWTLHTAQCLMTEQHKKFALIQ